MDFGFNDEQEQLRQAVRGYLSGELPASFARAMIEEPLAMNEAAWTQLARQGWLGLTVPESTGGSGLGLVELVLVMEAMGTVVLPGPYFSSIALAVPTILAVATSPQCQALLLGIADGSRRVTVAHCEAAGRWDVGGIRTSCVAVDGGYRLCGEKLFVPDAGGADSVVVVARMEDGGLGFFLVPLPSDGVTVEMMATVDETRRMYAVTFDSVILDADALLGGQGYAPEVLDELCDRAATALSAELCGLAEAALDLTVEYLQVREQFGRTLATFQALQHRMADMKVDLENAKSLTYYAAWAIDEKATDARRAAAMAKSYASDACPRIIADAIQLHGGIGFTWEHDLQLYFKRAKADEVLFGGPAQSRERVAQLLGL